MIKFESNGGILCKHIADIPQSFIGATKIYLDAETSSGDPTKMSTNPWQHCTIMGFSVTVDDCPQVYYCDARYTEDFWANGPQFIQDLLWYGALWINHHVKYDTHVFMNDFGIQLPPWLELKCTIVSAKLIDSDRGGARGGYGLDALSLNWLGEDISKFEAELKVYLGRNNKDYGRIPADKIAEYGCQDALTNRKLDLYIDGRLPERCKGVAETELKLTKELVYLERNGMRFNPIDLKMAQLGSLTRMAQIDAELSKIVGRSFRPGVNEDCNDVLCGHYGLPIVAYTKAVDTSDPESIEDANASFNKVALAKYEAMPYAPQDVISRIIEYRKLSQRNSLFFEPWQEYAPDGLLHPTYNQTVRTGRMSCSEPNAQQLDDVMASLIIPPEGWSIISTDASQIEFRMIGHYIQSRTIIDAYNANPDEDFHTFVANLPGIGVSRKPAKTINFGTAFGEGVKKLISQLASNPDIIKAVKAEVEAMNLTSEATKVQMFNDLVIARATQAYKAYHAAFPEIKQTSKQAEAVCKSPERRLGLAGDSNHYYGYITNLYGRDRHLPYAKYRTDFKTRDPYDKAWLAFPTLNSSSAADLMKERFVELRRNVIGDLPIHSIAIVHDELVFIAPNDIAYDPRTVRDIIATLESPAAEISVPIRWSIGVSDMNWLDAATGVDDGGKSSMLKYDKSTAQRLDWLR